MIWKKLVAEAVQATISAPRKRETVLVRRLSLEREPKPVQLRKCKRREQ
jgi:hypothetical protein